MREESPLLSPEMTREFLQSQLTGEEEGDLYGDLSRLTTPGYNA